jgi:endonuclease/exonuclease/phosphatase family metal-dependent hydrolase
VQDLVSLLGGFEWVGVGRDDGREKGEMNAVLVRRSAYAIESQKTLWLSETPQQVSRGWDAMLNRTVTLLKLKNRTTGKELHFLNTHFDHMGKQSRDESARLIVQTIQALGASLPVILTGDFNARPDFAGYRTLTTRLQDAAVVSRTPATGGGISFNGFGKDLQPGNKIDYVFVSPGPEVQSHRLITDLYKGLYASDHFPVLVEVLLR